MVVPSVKTRYLAKRIGITLCYCLTVEWLVLQGQSWKYLSIVLKADFHLSYPFVFQHEGRVFMMPEGNSALTLYESVNFPLEWKPFKVLPH